MDYKIVLVFVLLILLFSLCFNCVIGEMFQSEVTNSNNNSNNNSNKNSNNNSIDVLIPNSNTTASLRGFNHNLKVISVNSKEHSKFYPKGHVFNNSSLHPNLSLLN